MPGATWRRAGRARALLRVTMWHLMVGGTRCLDNPFAYFRVETSFSWEHQAARPISSSSFLRSQPGEARQPLPRRQYTRGRSPTHELLDVSRSAALNSAPPSSRDPQTRRAWVFVEACGAGISPAAAGRPRVPRRESRQRSAALLPVALPPRGNALALRLACACGDHHFSWRAGGAAAQTLARQVLARVLGGVLLSQAASFGLCSALASEGPAVHPAAAEIARLRRAREDERRRGAAATPAGADEPRAAGSTPPKQP